MSSKAAYNNDTTRKRNQQKWSHTPMQNSKSDPDRKPLIYCLQSIHILHSGSILIAPNMECGQILGETSLLYTSSQWFTCLSESDVYSDFMYAYMH